MFLVLPRRPYLFIRRMMVVRLTTFCFCFPGKQKIDHVTSGSLWTLFLYHKEKFMQSRKWTIGRGSLRHWPAELGLGLNVPDTISPRLEEEFPLDLLLQWRTANRKKTGMSPSKGQMTRVLMNWLMSCTWKNDFNPRSQKECGYWKLGSHPPLPSDWTSS